MVEKSDIHSLTDSLSNALAGGKPYLGSLEYVQAMLHAYGQEVMERLVDASLGKTSMKDATDRDVAEAERLGRIFLGEDTDT